MPLKGNPSQKATSNKNDSKSANVPKGSDAFKSQGTGHIGNEPFDMTLKEYPAGCGFKKTGK